MAARTVTIAILLATLAVTANGFAAAPADSNIKSAVFDIDRYERQFTGKTSARASIVKRTLKLLSIARGNLDGSANQTHPSWIAADSRHTALVTHLQSLLAPAGAASSAATAPSTTRQPTTTPTPSAGASQMISQQRVRVKKLARDIKSAADTMNQGGVKPFQSPAYEKKFTDAAERYRQSLSKYADFANDPDVQAATGELQVLRNMIAFGNAEAAKVLTEIGDVQGQLGELYQRRRKAPRLELPQPPYTRDGIKQWIQQASGVRRAGVADYKLLQIINEKAYLPISNGTVEQGAAFDSQNVSSLLHGSESDVRKVDQQLQQLTANLDAQQSHIVSSIEWIEKLDPLDRKDQSNSFLATGADVEIHNRIAGLANEIAAAIAFDKRLKRDTLATREALQQRIENARPDYDRKRVISLDAMRMPDAASSDQELIRQATETLSNPDYEVGDIQRLIVNSDIRHQETESSEVEYDKVDISLNGDVKLSGTQTTTYYVWDQYQVATAEPIGDKYYVFYNTLKYFTKGGTTTPLNRWILSGRLQGSEILAGNIKR